MADSNLPRLTQSRSGTAKKLTNRIRLGEEIRDREIDSYQSFESAVFERDKWNRYNVDLLLQLFESPSISHEYVSPDGWVGEAKNEMDLFIGDKGVDAFRRNTNLCISRLESVVERLHFSDYVTESQETERTFGSNIFIVHGHDIAARESVKSLLHQLDLRPIVLQEEGSGGRTIIENFEAHAENSGFAVVLMTPDDTGYPGEQDDKAQGRARQNVVLEFGYFLALLGRQRVRVLYKEGVEIPSDLTGILYIPMDEGGAWQLKLAKEIKAAGFEIDLNAL